MNNILCVVTAAVALSIAPHANPGPANDQARPASPVRVVMVTELGSIELEVDAARAPASAANFLKYVAAGKYNGGRFHRTVRPDNRTDKPVPIGVIQGASAANGPDDLFPPVALERTRDTGLKHTAHCRSPVRASIPPPIISSSASAISPSSISAAGAIPTGRGSPPLAAWFPAWTS